jgi:hypothetical protein
MRGAIPDDLREALEAEGVVHIEERVRGAISFRDFRAPGAYKSRAYRGLLRFTLALTKSRIVVYGWRGKNVDVRWTDPAVHGLELSVSRRGRLVIAIDVRRFRSDWSGAMAIHLACEDPAATLRLIGHLRGEMKRNSGLPDGGR